MTLQSEQQQIYDQSQFGCAAPGVSATKSTKAPLSPSELISTRHSGLTSAPTSFSTTSTSASLSAGESNAGYSSTFSASPEDSTTAQFIRSDFNFPHHYDDDSNNRQQQRQHGSQSLYGIYQLQEQHQQVHQEERRQKDDVKPQQSAQPIKAKRQSAACTRCRRYRQKCIHSVEQVAGSSRGDQGSTTEGSGSLSTSSSNNTKTRTRPVAPCQGCIDIGTPEDCVFTPRGQSAADRSFRRRLSASSSSTNLAGATAMAMPINKVSNRRKSVSTSSSSMRKTSLTSLREWSRRSPTLPSPTNSESFPSAGGAAKSDGTFGVFRSRTSSNDRNSLQNPSSLSGVAIVSDAPISHVTHAHLAALSRPSGLVAPAPPAYEPFMPPSTISLPPASPPSPHFHGSGSFHPDSRLPPVEEVVEAVKKLVGSYLQMAFINESHFIDRLRHDPDSISPFLVSSILAASARFTPSLVARFGSRFSATERFSAQAHDMIVQEASVPSLEACQAFLLLSACEWGQGLGQRAHMLSGIAVRMASMLRLHREETYSLRPNPTMQEVIESETARRTFWTIHLYDNLYRESSRSISFPPEEISAFLPCEEEDYLLGRLPRSRSSLVGTAAATLYPQTAHDPDQNLFSSMVHAAAVWGKVASKACLTAETWNERPWEVQSEFASLHHELRQLEQRMPLRHRFNHSNLAYWKAMNGSTAYFMVNNTLRLAHLVLARMYLPLLATNIKYEDASSALTSTSSCQSSPETSFWAKVAHLMSAEASEVLSQTNLFFANRGWVEGYPPFMLFGVYLAGDVASYLCRWPHLCPEFAGKAPAMFVNSVDILSQEMEAWPIAQRWHALLSLTGALAGGVRSLPDLDSCAKLDSALDRRNGLHRNNSNFSDTSGGSSGTTSATNSNPQSPLLTAASSDAMLSVVSRHNSGSSASISPTGLEPSLNSMVLGRNDVTSSSQASHNQSVFDLRNQSLVMNQLSAMLEATPRSRNEPISDPVVSIDYSDNLTPIAPTFEARDDTLLPAGTAETRWQAGPMNPGSASGSQPIQFAAPNASQTYIPLQQTQFHQQQQIVYPTRAGLYSHNLEYLSHPHSQSHSQSHSYLQSPYSPHQQVQQYQHHPHQQQQQPPTFQSPADPSFSEYDVWTA